MSGKKERPQSNTAEKIPKSRLKPSNEEQHKSVIVVPPIQPVVHELRLRNQVGLHTVYLFMLQR